MAYDLHYLSERHDIDMGERLLTEIDISRQTDMGSVASNAFGEHYLFAINRNLFQGTDASTVFRSYFGESIFKEDTFYVIAGTDSGLLYQYIKTQGLPKGSRYLFVELPQVLALLANEDTSHTELAITTGEDWLKQAEEMAVAKYAFLGRMTLLRSLGAVHGHCNDYQPFWRKLKGEFDAFVQTIRFRSGTRPFIICQIENLTENQIPAICLRDAFQGKTGVVLAGGPSLDELLPWVRQQRQNLLVIAASRISHSLLQAGIQPDISVSVDPQAFNLNVCKDMLEFQDGTLLVNQYHLSSNLLASWGGQKVFIGHRYPWPTPLQPENIFFTGGTTITNVALDLAIETGVAQIILGGVDFCFSRQGHTHASGTVEHSIGSRPQLCEVQVETNAGIMADTDIGYRDSGRHIDYQAENANARGCRVINPAPGAMRLPHVEHLSPDDIQIEPLERPAREILAGCVPAADANSKVRHYKEVLGEVDRMLAELRAIKGLSGKALNYNRKVLIKADQQGDSNDEAGKINPAYAEKVARIKEQFTAKYADTISFVMYYGVSNFIPIHGLDLNQLEDRVQNNEIYFQACVDTCSEVSEILRQARTRILSRLEEEKSQPNMQRLMSQWQHDQQPGRAIQWARQHASHVAQLPTDQQQALQAFQATFEDTVEKLGLQYLGRIEQEVNLDGICAKSREYFLCHDQDGLLRLQASLEKFRDQEQAANFTPLVEGYLAELSNDSVSALDAYRKITEGPAHIDALTRLFELHTRAEDWESALKVLKTLSEISPTYSPMYADLLYSCNHIDTAVEIYTDYLLANPDDLNTMMKLGKVFRECGSIEGVTWAMNYILGKDPMNHVARQILCEVEQSQVTDMSHP
jgi:hypothetical protein